MILKARPGRGEIREYKAAVVADAWCACEPKRFLIKAFAATLRHRDGQQTSVSVVGPAVIAAHEPGRMTPTLIHHLRASVTAAVDQHLHTAVAVATHDHGLTAELSGDVVARLRHLTGVADEQPSRSENAFHLELEQFGIGIDSSMDAARLDEFCNVFRVSVEHDL